MADKDRKMFVGIILLLFAFMIFVGILAFRDKKSEIASGSTTDALLFKNEYESLNNVVREKDGKTIRELSISQNNPVDILTEEETLRLLQEGTGIVYFGFADCPWCRTLLPVLFKTLDNMSISRLYYLNISNIRDTLVLNDKNKVEIKEEGTQGYYKILEELDAVLDPYYLETKDGKKVDTKKKRLFAPTLVGVKNGEIVGIHVGTVESQASGYDNLTTEEEEELSKAIQELTNKVYDLHCDEAC